MFFVFFWFPAPRDRKNTKITTQSLPRALWGPPREPEIDQLCASGRARRPTNNLFWLPGPPPGAIWSLPGGRLGPTWRPEAPRRPPGPDFVPPGPLRGAFLLSLMCSTLVSHSSHVMFLFVFACVLVFALLFFEDVDALISEFRSPRSLKPWVAAGGREAIRINERTCSDSGNARVRGSSTTWDTPPFCSVTWDMASSLTLNDHIGAFFLCLQPKTESMHI